MTARPIAALLPTGLPAVTIAELARFCDGARTVFSGGKHANAALACVTGNRALVREYLRAYIDDVRHARRRDCSDTYRYEAGLLMLWRLSREVHRG